VGRFDNLHVQADTDGNIWLLRRQWIDNREVGDLKVFTAGKWLDAKDALIQAGSNDGKLTHLFPLGETKKILAANNLRQKNTKSMFILSIHDKQIKVEPLDDIYSGIGSNNVPYVVYSPHGEPWIDIRRPGTNNTSLPFTCRYTENGPTQAIESMRAVAADVDGSLLISDIYTSPATHLKLFRDDAIIELPDLPMLRSRERITFIAPGIICQPTDLGLQITNLNDPANPTIYTGATTCSHLGFAVAHIHATATPGNPPPPNLFFYPLKKP